MDLGLVLDGNVPVTVADADRVTLTQPDADHLVITLIDDSGRAIESFEEIVFARYRRGIRRVENRARDFRCGRDGSLTFGWDWGADGTTADVRRRIGRLPDGGLAVGLYESAIRLFGRIDQQWHRYEKVPSREPSP